MEKGTKRTGDESDSLHCKKRKNPFANYLFELPSLKNLASVSITIQLWTVSGMKEEVEKIPSFSLTNLGNEYLVHCYENVKVRVLSRLDKILLPTVLKLEIVDIIRPIGIQFFRCYEFRELDQHKFFALIKLKCSIHWTNDGLIDPIKSFKQLIYNPVNIDDIYLLYNMACSYCSKDLTSVLYKKILEISDGFSDSELESLLNHSKKSYSFHLKVYWTAVYKNELSYFSNKILQDDYYGVYSDELCFYGNMVSLSIFQRNTFALKYFWPKLAKQEQDNNLEKWLWKAIDDRNRYLKVNNFGHYHLNSTHGQIIFFLLSHLIDQNQQMKVFQTHSKPILDIVFYEWPFQRFFLPTFTEMLDYLQIDDYFPIVLQIIERIETKRTSNNLLMEILCISPLGLKEHFLTHFNTEKGVSTLLKLLSNKNFTVVFALLNCFSEEARKDILLKMIDKKNFENLTIDELNFFETLSIKTLSSCNVKLFKERVMSKYAEKMCKNWILLGEYEAADKLLNWGFSSQSEDKSQYLSSRGIKRFKEDMMVKYAENLCKDWIRSGRFEVVENFLNWGFPSQSDIQTFKTVKLNSIELFLTCVDVGGFECANRFLSWYFESEEEIGQFGKTFLRKHNTDDYVRLLVLLSFHNETGWSIFEKLFDLSLYSLKECARLKTLATTKIGCIVSFHNYKFASSLLSWCFDSVSEVIQFKEELMLSNECLDIFINWLKTDYQDWDKIKATLKWFFPISSETISKLKIKLSTEKVSEWKGLGFFIKRDKMYSFFNLLDTCSSL